MRRHAMAMPSSVWTSATSAFVASNNRSQRLREVLVSRCRRSPGFLQRRLKVRRASSGPDRPALKRAGHTYPRASRHVSGQLDIGLFVQLVQRSERVPNHGKVQCRGFVGWETGTRLHLARDGCLREDDDHRLSVQRVRQRIMVP